MTINLNFLTYRRTYNQFRYVLTTPHKRWGSLESTVFFGRCDGSIPDFVSKLSLLVIFLELVTTPGFLLCIDESNYRTETV